MHVQQLVCPAYVYDHERHVLHTRITSVIAETRTELLHTIDQVLYVRVGAQRTGPEGGSSHGRRGRDCALLHHRDVRTYE